MPKTIYVPTGEVRKAREGEFFAPLLTEHNGGECDCHRQAVNGVRVERCYIDELGIEAEIYEAVTING